MSLNSKPTKTTPNRLVLSTKYCDNAHKIRRSLTDCWKELHKSEDLREIFPNPPTLASRRHPSLRNKLVKAKLPTTEDNDNVQDTQRSHLILYPEFVGPAPTLRTLTYPYTQGNNHLHSNVVGSGDLLLCNL